MAHITFTFSLVESYTIHNISIRETHVLGLKGLLNPNEWINETSHTKGLPHRAHPEHRAFSLQPVIGFSLSNSG